MGKLALLLISLLISTHTYADAKRAYCNTLQDSAKSIMNIRQNGMPMAELMDIIDKTDGTENDRKIHEELVINAYENPRYGSEKMKNMAVVDFQNDTYLTCIKHYKPGK